MSEESIYPMGGGEGQMPTSMIGLDYVPGKESDAKISELLGLEEGVAWSRNAKKGAEALKELDVTWGTYTINGGAELIVIFLHGNDFAAFTKPFHKESHAISCVLHHLALQAVTGDLT